MASTKSIMARSAKFITDLSSDTNWKLHLTIFDIEHIGDEIPRLYRSQSWGDPDYTNNVFVLLSNILDYDENLATDFVKYVITQDFDLDDPTVISKDKSLLEALGLIKGDAKLEVTFPKVELKTEKLIDVTTFPDEFYTELKDHINHAYSIGIIPAVEILIRKMLENLIIDIIRKKYGTSDIDLYYDTDHGRFVGFNMLLKNISGKLSDFKSISDSFDIEFIRDLNAFRIKGNAQAHNIEINVSRGEIIKNKELLNYSIKLLVRVFNNV